MSVNLADVELWAKHLEQGGFANARGLLTSLVADYNAALLKIESLTISNAELVKFRDKAIVDVGAFVAELPAIASDLKTFTSALVALIPPAAAPAQPAPAPVVKTSSDVPG